MKIQKGMVKYKDRNDIICIYGVTDDGKTYYFLDSEGKPFVNGNYIASTELVEAIDPMYKASKVGVIDSNGNAVIACENKGVKQITDDVILVEKAVPVTESVLQALERRSDSLYAAQLVSTPAQIKDNIYREMGNDGRFLFNDQFAEATIFDINGNNLVNNEVYSFIAINNNQLYLSKNVPESPVVQFKLGVENVEENVQTETPVEEISNEQEVSTEVEETSNLDNFVEENETIDVNDVSVPMDVVENALEGIQATEPEHNVIQDNFEVDTHTPLENVNEGLELPSTADFLAATNVGIPLVHEDDAFQAAGSIESQAVENVVETVEEPVNETESVSNVETVEEPIEEEVNNSVNEVTEDVVAEEINDTVEESVVEEETVNSENEVDIPVAEEVIGVEEPVEEVVTEEVENVVETFEENDNSEVIADNEEEVQLHISADEETEYETEEVVDEEKEEPLEEEQIQSLLDETSMDLFNGTPLQLDSIVSENSADELDTYSFHIPETTDSRNIYDEVAKSMASLIKQVREHRATIANYEEIIDGLNADKAELQGKVIDLENQNIELSDRNRTFENGVVKLKTRIEMLATKLHEKDDVIERQNKELRDLRLQSEGKTKLFSLLRDAEALVGDEGLEEEYSYIKAA